MSDYRRYYVEGGTYFFTVVTCRRVPFLTTELGRACLRAAFQAEQEANPFRVEAIVLLPDHLHTIWTLPPEDADYSTRWGCIKEQFTRAYLAAGGREVKPSQSRRRHRERGIWQRRFWEHTCRDEVDFKRFLDYIHYNPVKHGLVANVRDYIWSSFSRYVELGEYELNWGEADPWPQFNAPEWE